MPIDHLPKQVKLPPIKVTLTDEMPITLPSTVILDQEMSLCETFSTTISHTCKMVLQMDSTMELVATMILRLASLDHNSKNSASVLFC
jgi:hypothetical protein